MACEVSVRLQKDYVDRGTQTQSAESPIFSEADLPVSGEYPCLVIPQRAVPKFESCMSESAYSRLQSTGNPVPSECQPSRASHRLRGHPPTLYNRPVESHRVVSLPGRISSFKEQQSNETKLRIVSNPDYLRLSSSGFGVSSSADPCDDSGSTDACSIDQDPVWSCYRHPTRACSPTDVPRTPSPPSSPESITIIGNDSQVPASFLRRQNHLTCAYADPNGWISWAKSPPKPIPALHGPSSLPYARCPSGAEGTVIDGEDLSHMIWGLDISTSFSKPRKITGQGSVPPRLQKTHNSTLILRSAEVREPVDLSGPVALYHQFEAQERHPFSTASDRKSQQNEQTSSTLYAGPVRGDHSQHPSVDGIYEDSWRSGLGIQLDRKGNLLEYPLNNTTEIKYPNSSAAIFIPAQSQQYSCPRVIIEPRTGFRTDQAPRRLSALDIAQQYQAMQHLQNSLPTPPSSSSSQWKPIFLPTYVDVESPAPLEQTIGIGQQLQSSGPQETFHASDYTPHDPRLFSERYKTSGTDTPGIALTATQDSGNISSATNSAYGTHRVYEAEKLLNLMSHLSLPSPDTEPFASLSPSPSRPAHSIGSDLSRESNGNDLLSPLPPDFRRNLSHRQPRSIPLARLIQRRLSSVTEEDPVRDKLSPNLVPRNACGAHFSGNFKIRTFQGPIESQDPIITALAPQTQTDDLVESIAMLESTPIQLVPNTNVTVKLPAKGTSIGSKFTSNIGPEARDKPTGNESPGVMRKTGKIKKKGTRS